MSKPRRNAPLSLLDDALFGVKLRKAVPHGIVLDAIAQLSPETRPLFGCLAVYVEDKIVLILREKRDNAADNGVWLATTVEHHQSLRWEFPNMRSIRVFGKKVTDWQVLPADAPDFEQAALRACELIIARDPRIGKIPGARRMSGLGAKRAAKSSKRLKSAKNAANERFRGKMEGLRQEPS
jgi:hypothetical protein